VWSTSERCIRRKLAYLSVRSFIDSPELSILLKNLTGISRLCTRIHK